MAWSRATTPADPVLPTAIAIGAATGAYGLSFGVLADAAGLSLAQIAAMSTLVFTGATQLSVAGVLAAGGTVPAALVGGWLLAARHVAYGVALARVLRGSRIRRALGAQLVIDETTAMATAEPDPARAERAFWATGLSVFVFWNVASLAGALGGRTLADPTALGLDAVFPAAFLALLVPQLRRPGARPAAVMGALLAAALVPVAPAGVPVLVASAGVFAGLRRA